jgi:hypothetical protein
MNHIAAFLLLINFSCNSQSDKRIDIKGNWYNYQNTTSESSYYVETFIDENTFYYFNEFSGLMPEMKYKIEKNILYQMSLDGEEKKYTGKIKIIDKNTFSIIKDGEIIIFKRVVEGLNMEDFLFKDKSEDDYWAAFNKRKLIWEKKAKHTD